MRALMLRAPLLTALTVLTVLTVLVVRACSLVSLGAMRSWWLLPGGFGSWVWRRLVALGCLVWGLAGWGSWPRPAIVWRPGLLGVSHLPRPA